MNNVAGINYACKAPASWISHSRKLFVNTNEEGGVKSGAYPCSAS